MKLIQLVMYSSLFLFSCHQNEKSWNIETRENQDQNAMDYIDQAIQKRFPKQRVSVVQYEYLNSDTILDALVISEEICDEEINPEIFCRTVSLLIKQRDSSYVVLTSNDNILDPYDEEIEDSHSSIELLGDSLKFTSIYGGCAKTIQYVWFTRGNDEWFFERMQTDSYSCLEENANKDGSISITSVISEKKDVDTITFEEYKKNLND